MEQLTLEDCEPEKEITWQDKVEPDDPPEVIEAAKAIFGLKSE